MLIIIVANIMKLWIKYWKVELGDVLDTYTYISIFYIDMILVQTIQKESMEIDAQTTYQIIKEELTSWTISVNMCIANKNKQTDTLGSFFIS